ncbi:MAG TPA: succinylglutamate desuccinylase, partial [Roseateles sp.]|nr:succinylglutamate desuccinylase [Roseateles sp.]
SGVQPRNLVLARALQGEAAIVIDAGHADGVRMRDFGRFGAPDAQAPETRSLLLECGHHLDPASRGVAQDYCARLLLAADVVDEADLEALLPGWLRRNAVVTVPALRVRGAVVARSERFRFDRPYTGLERIVRAGTVIGDNDGEPVRTPFADCVLVMPSTRQARAGVTVVRFAEVV